MNKLFSEELGLPARGKSMRTTRRPNLDPGDKVVLFDGCGPGCIFHWWICYSIKQDHDVRDPAHDLQLKIYYDGKSNPDVDLPLAKYFGILFDFDVYDMDSAAIKMLPKNAFNCYLPMPFRALRIEIENLSNRATAIWFMADWQKFKDDTPLTDMRLQIVHKSAYPAETYGSFLMADLSGEGFVAGMVKGVRVKDDSDGWFHTGGDLWLLDGEHNPSALRGIGGEDAFNMSFGIWDTQTDWIGAPYIHQVGEHTAVGSGYEGVMYRFFGPDPVWFDHSAIIRFGSKANDLESLIYTYLQPRNIPEVLTVPSWQLAGPFLCISYDHFENKEWADNDVSTWPASYTADFGQYLGVDGPTEINLPQQLDSEHGWCDFSRCFRGRKKANVGTQPSEVSAYAVGRILIPEEGDYVFDVGFDDWLRLWINGNELHSNRHDCGFEIDTVAVKLPTGECEIRVKLSNYDNMQWRLWAFCVTAKKV